MDVNQDVYYKRLSKLSLWPLIAALGVISAAVTAQVMIFYFRYIPDIISPVEKEASPEAVALLSYGINKIIINMSVWFLVLISLNVLFAYVVWNVRKLLAHIDSSLK